jgi:hypothetical protein
MVNFNEQIFLFVWNFIIFLAVMELNHSHLPDHLVFGGEDLGIGHSASCWTYKVKLYPRTGH